MTDPSYRELVVRLDERVAQLKESTETGFAHVEEKFIEAGHAVDLARGQYPTQKDIQQGLEAGRTEAREIAREEAARSYERAAQESKAQADKAEAALNALAERTEATQRAIAAQTEATQKALADQLKSFRDEMLDKIEDVKSSRGVVTVVGVLSGLAVVGSVILAVARG